MEYQNWFWKKDKKMLKTKRHEKSAIKKRVKNRKMYLSTTFVTRPKADGTEEELQTDREKKDRRTDQYTDRQSRSF